MFHGIDRRLGMSASAFVDSEMSILTRVIGTDETVLAPEVAREFLGWTFSDFDQQRMSWLAEKARAGTLSPEERAESESYERVSSFIGILKSKARRSLRTTPHE
jgi:hypothetical protein